VKVSTTYPSAYPFKSAKEILYVCEPMNPDIFNMGVRILAPNALESANGQQLESTTVTPQFENHVHSQ
jgi:hypothetical protein